VDINARIFAPTVGYRGYLPGNFWTTRQVFCWIEEEKRPIIVCFTAGGWYARIPIHGQSGGAGGSTNAGLPWVICTPEKLPRNAVAAPLDAGGAAGKIFGGWKLTQNWNAQSGVPMLISAPCNKVSCRPDLIGDPSQGRSGKSRQQLENQWFNGSVDSAK